MDFQDVAFKKAKTKLTKMIAKETWDYVELSDLQYATVKMIMNAECYDDVAGLVNLDFISCIVSQVERKFKTKQREEKEAEKEEK